MKKNPLKLCFIFLAAAILWLGISVLLDRRDRAHCLCSVLTAETQTLPIDERVYRVCDKEAMRSGTFMVIYTKCVHGNRLSMTIMPDAGIYRGHVSEG